MSSSTPLERYQKLCLRESLPKVYRYPIVCKELSFILKEAYDKLAKNVQASIFEDTLTAFRLLPVIQTQNAVTSAHLLLQSVEAVLPKQKRNITVKEFKQAMVTHKRRCKATQEGTGSSQLPHDILIHIFSFLDMQSLVSTGLVCWSWYSAASDNHLWELQHAVLYGSSVKEHPIRLVESSKNTLLQEPVDATTSIDWKEAVKRAYTGALSKILASNRGYCQPCKCVVWLNNLKCPNGRCNGRCGMMSEVQDIRPVTASQVAEYLLDDYQFTSSSDSDSDNDNDEIMYGGFYRLWAFPKHIK